MTTGILENPIDPWNNPNYHPSKCSVCGSKSFAVYLPKNLDKEYESCDEEERKGKMFRRLFKGLSDAGEYYQCVRITCAKCGEYLEDPVTFMPLGDWNPPEKGVKVQ